MKLEFKVRETFNICGYCVETSLETCGEELSKLWCDFETRKEELFRMFGVRKDFYGLMWKTQNGRYCYLIGIEADSIGKLPDGVVCKQILPANYAVYDVAAGKSAFDAWTEYYEKTLPDAGYTPNAGHGFDFEYYPNGGGEAYQLWTPVAKT